MKLTEYDSADPIFVDANVLLDFALADPDHGRASVDFLERIELEEIKAITTPAVLTEVSYILLLQKGLIALKTRNRNLVREKIKADSNLSGLCYDAVDKLNEYLSNLAGLKSIAVQPEDHLLASDLGRTYRLLSSDALHLAAMRRNHIQNIATRDRDFERADGIMIWSQ